VNNTVITNTTVVNVQNINVYRNANVRNAVVVVNENRFGRGPITSARVTQVDAKSLQLIHTAPQIAATPASFVPTASRGIRPPEESLKRSVVATRPPHRQEESASGAQRTVGPAGVPAPAPRIVTAPQQREPASVLPRPPFGQSTAERPAADLTRPPSPPGVGGPRRPEKGSEGAPAVTRQASPQPGREPQASPSPAAPAPPAARVQPPAPPQKQGGPQGPEKAAESVPPVTRQAAPPPGREPQVASPSPAAPKPPAAAVTAPPPSARRPEAATPPARPLPGEPANRLAPNRAEKSPPQPVEPRAKGSPEQAGQRSAPEGTQQERPSGR
jgi:hypothetical protein